MPYLDRNSFIALLEQLGSDNDQEVLAAARELDARVRAAGVGWHELLTPARNGDDQRHEQDEDEYDEDYDEDDYDEDDYDDEEPVDSDIDEPGRRETEAVVLERQRGGAAGADQDSAELIDRLLQEFDLSEETRQDLLDLKQDIAAGEFTAMDRRYLEALSARLSKG